MESRTIHFISSLLVLLLIAFLSTAPQVLATDQQPFSVPISSHLLDATLILPDGTEGSVQVRDGGMITIRDNKTGEVHHLVPAISRENAESVDVLVLRGFRTPNGAEGVEQVGDPQPLTIGDSTSSLELTGGFEVTFTKISERVIEDDLIGQDHQSVVSALGDEDKPPVPEGGSCCVNCGSYTVCGCNVSLSCGSCCADGCCGGGGSPRQQTVY